MHREDILGRMFQVASANQSLISTGILEIMDEGYGFLRQVSSYRHSGDVYIPQSQIRRFGLRTGDTITGQVRPPKEASATSAWSASRRSTASTPPTPPAGFTAATVPPSST